MYNNSDAHIHVYNRSLRLQHPRIQATLSPSSESPKSQVGRAAQTRAACRCRLARRTACLRRSARSERGNGRKGYPQDYGNDYYDQKGKGPYDFVGGGWVGGMDCRGVGCVYVCVRVCRMKFLFLISYCITRYEYRIILLVNNYNR